MYLRKSRADKELEARGEGETLARHERALQALAERLELPVSAVYREIVSGETISSRPVMQALLSEVEQGAWDGVFVMEVERLARGDTIDQGIVAQAFRCTNTRILTPAKIYDPANESDEEYFEFGLFMSRREYKTINRRLQRGRTASASEGRYPGSLPPYGYRRARLDGQKGFTLVPDPEQAAAVNLIFSLYVHGRTQPSGETLPLGAGRIAEELDRLQIPTARGGGWSAATVYTILHNPVYIGKTAGARGLLSKKAWAGGCKKHARARRPKTYSSPTGCIRPSSTRLCGRPHSKKPRAKHPRLLSPGLCKTRWRALSPAANVAAGWSAGPSRAETC
ncbi:MAG: recombinase family protein [Oscillospiraceae bacterium]